MPKNPTIEQFNRFEEWLKNPQGKLRTTLAAELSLNKSTLQRWHKWHQRDRARFDRFAAAIKAGKNASWEMRKAANPTTAIIHSPGRPSSPFAPKILKLKAQGMSVTDITAELKLAEGTVKYHYYGGLEAARERYKRNKSNSHGTNGEQLREKAIRLRDEGIRLREIASQLNISQNRLNWVLYGKTKNREKENLNGRATTTTSTTLTTQESIGVAYAEVERFLGVLTERLGISPKLLRSRLSELLGHSPLR